MSRPIYFFFKIFTLAWALSLVLTVADSANADPASSGKPTAQSGAIAGDRASKNSGEVTDERVGRAIEQIKAYLYEKQDSSTGSWEFRSNARGIQRDINQRGAETAVVTYALLVSGESFQNPKLARAIKFLGQLNPTGTYAISMRAHVWARLPRAWLAMLEKDAGWLMQAADQHPQGLFYYQIGQPTDFIDNGVVQYGLLGLWEASKRGFRIPDKYWNRWMGHFLASQRSSGNWTYAAEQDTTVGGAGSGNIFDTTGIGDAANSGLASMLIIQQELFSQRKHPDPKVAQAIQNGLDWLDQHFDMATGQSGYNHYYAFGIERTAAASGVRLLNGQDWYQAGARQIIKQLDVIKKSEYDSLQMSFALMFLSRGRYPVWISKLKVPDLAWNNRPNDLHFLNLYLSDQREGELNWQVINVNDTEPEAWLTSPVLYLSSDQAVDFTQAQRQRLKHYLDAGGLLVASGENRSTAFNQSMRRLAKDMYPQYEWTPLPSDDALCRSWRTLPSGLNVPVYSVSNGSRHLMLVVQGDWGYALQSDENPGQGWAWDFAANLFAYATDRGVPNNRLVTLDEPRMKRAKTGSITVGRARYEGNWLPEPASWDAIANLVFNQTGLEITTTPSEGPDVLELERIDTCELPLVHLAGVDSIVLTQPQINAIRSYVESGGVLLVENVGGQGGFSRSVAGQLRDLFSMNLAPLVASDAVISGQTLSGGNDCRQVLYRRYTSLKSNPGSNPTLTAFLDANGLPKVIVSDMDLSTAALGGKTWGVHGYQTTSSRKLLTNILLWVEQQSQQLQAH